MSETSPGIEEHDEHPDELAGEQVDPEHDLDVDTFDDEDEEGDES